MSAVWGGLAVLGAMAVMATLFVWWSGQISRTVVEAFRQGSEAGTRATFGVVPQSETPPEAGEAGVRSGDGFENHPFAQERVVSVEEAERLMARLAPWDHEEGNPFE